MLTGPDRLRADYARVAGLASDAGDAGVHVPPWSVWVRMPSRARTVLESRTKAAAEAAPPPPPPPPRPSDGGRTMWDYRTGLEAAWSDEDLRAANARYVGGARDSETVRAWRAYQRISARAKRARRAR
jgi:hypothetical protein